MDDIDNITLCGGENQTVYFTGRCIDLDSSTWTNNNTAIGLGANGNGDIAFTSTNTETVSLFSTITMIPKSSAGCTNGSKSFIITVNPLPVMDDIDNLVVCTGENQIIHFSDKNIDLDSSTWTNSNTAIGLDANGKGHISFTAVNTGTIPLLSTIIMSPKSNEGCSIESKLFSITVNPLPVMEDVKNVVLCAGEYQTIHFTGRDLDLDNSTWTNSNPSIGLGRKGQGDISFTATDTITTSLISTITILPKSVNGCISDAKTFTITVNALPKMDEVENATLCTEIEETVKFTGINIDANHSTWTNSNPAIGLMASGKGDISFRTANFEPVPLTATVKMMPKSSTGCVGVPKSFNITVNPDIRIRAVVNDSLFCEGSNIEFDVLNQDELINIHWTGPDYFSSLTPNPTISNVSLNNSGMYYVHAITYYNCEAISDSLFISVVPAITFDMEDTVYICDSEIVLSSNVENATAYWWNTGKATKNIVTSSTGKYWITASNQRCLASDTVVVAETRIPSFEIQTIGNICQDGSINLYVDIADENLSYNWSTGETTDNITVYQSGVYRVDISVLGCTSAESIKIECPCDFWVPDMFTPNGDGLNEHFIPIPKSPLNTFSMFIYDRWGNLMFRTDTYTPWDGTNNGKDAAIGVYTYVIDYTCVSNPDKKQQKQGSISILR
jgi:gliding motility-associated-like protein